MKHSVNHRPWINFKELRMRLKFEEVLRHYKVEVRRRGEQHHGPCPIPGHTGSKTAPMFSANLTRGIFQCFGCKAKGNTLEFAALMEKVNLEDGDALREVAVKLQERFFPEGASSKHRQEKTSPPASPPAPAPVTLPKQRVVATSLPTLINAPMDFVLKGLDHGHAYLVNQGFAVATLQYFGVGFCYRGLFANRIVIPLHNAEGKLVGYAGRLVDESTVSESNPLYLFPSKREREGRVLDFDKTLLLYNGHHAKAAFDELIVVEDFSAVWWLTQCGFPHVVALMGSECSEEQVMLVVSLVKESGRVWVLPSGDKTSLAMAEKLVPVLASYRFVRLIRLGEGGQPTDLAPDELKVCFTL